MASNPPQLVILRQVGLLEQFSTARHSLGYYRCVGNTARYSIDHHIDDLSAILEIALAKVILRYPPLCCGIINENTKDPSFVRLESIDVSKCIDYRILDSSTPEEYEQNLIKIIEHQHRQLWPDIHCQPAWKLIVVQSKSQTSERTVFDAMFAYHHAIADGLSGMIPDSINLLPPMEDMIKFQISWRYLLTTLWHVMKPQWLFPDPSPPWTSAIVSPIIAKNYESCVKLITVPSNHVTTILAACREQKTTLTGLLHGLIVTSLTRRVPNATSFTASTPFSPRNLSGLSSTSDIAAQVCSHPSRYTPDVISAIRASSNPAHVTDQIWKIARDFRVSLAADIAQMPKDNIVGLLPYVSNIQNMFTSKMGKPRGDTFEVSNVGTLKNEGGEGQWRIERDIFTQSGMATGPAFSFNLASVVGGPLTISVAWLEGVMEEKLVGVIVEDVRYSLRCIAEEREVSLGYSD